MLQFSFKVVRLTPFGDFQSLKKGACPAAHPHNRFAKMSPQASLSNHAYDAILRWT